MQLDPIECTDKRRGSQKVSGKLVVARRDTPPVLDATEVVLDGVAPPIKAFGTIGFLGGIAAARDDRQGTFIFDLLTDLLAVVGFVSRDGEWRLGSIKNVTDHLAVVNLAARHRKVQRPPLTIDDGMDFRGATTATDTDRLVLLPPFAPLAARWAFTIVLSIRYRLSRDFAANVSKICFQMPRRDQRLNRLYAVVYGP